METATLKSDPLLTIAPSSASRPLSLRGPGFAVLAGLFLLYGFEVFRGLDFRDGDDLVRHAMARAWVSHPYFMIGKGYWPTLPAIVRGTVLGVVSPWVLPQPWLVLITIRLVTLAFLWGCWHQLARCVTLLGGGRVAVLLFTSFYLFNGGTLSFTASAYAEPDCLFFFLVALTLALRCISEADYAAARLFLIGLALAPACLTRYEAWSFPLALGGVLVYAARRHGLRPWRRWIGLFIPALPIGLWIVLTAIYQGDPFSFLEIGRSYRHLGASFIRIGTTSLETLQSYLAIHPLWVPVALLAGLAELYRRRFDPRWEAYTLFFALFLAWALYRLWSFHMGVRYTWDSALMIAVPGALALERAAQGRPRLRRPLLAIFAAVNLAAFIWISVLLVPFIDPGLRAFARQVQRQTGQKKILICDLQTLFDSERDLQVFRLTVATDRLILAEWFGRDHPVAGEDLRREKIEYILNRSYHGSLTAGKPLLVESRSGWMLWRSSLTRSPEADAKGNAGAS